MTRIPDDPPDDIPNTAPDTTPTDAPRILMVGLSCLDHLWQVERFPPQHSRTTATGYRVQGGGPAATAAVTAARLGAKAELWAIHGDDANGQLALAELRRYGVDVSQLRTPAGTRTWVSAILVTPEGERFIFPYRGNGGDSAEGFELARLRGVACVLTDARHPVMSEAVLVEAKRLGIPVVADMSNTRHWSLSRYADYLLVSEECAAEVLGRNDPEAALARLEQNPDQLVGITLGEQGFLYRVAGEVRHIPAFPVEVVDTTGAGDVFHGAYAFAVAYGWDHRRAGLFASVTAGLSCTALGRAGIPTAAEVETLLTKKSAREMDERWT